MTEYQAEILVNENGDHYVAEFPKGVTEPAQYGSSVSATAVYLSQFQLIPQAWVQACFTPTRLGLISTGFGTGYIAFPTRTSEGIRTRWAKVGS